MAFQCSICGEISTDICARCTKDSCANHLCEKCRRCSDCCECEVRRVEQAESRPALKPETAPPSGEAVLPAETV